MRRVVCNEIVVKCIGSSDKEAGVKQSIGGYNIKHSESSSHEKQSLVSTQTKSSSQPKSNKSKEIYCTVSNPV